MKLDRLEFVVKGLACLLLAMSHPVYAETLDGDRIIVIDGDTVALPCIVPARGCAEKIRIAPIDAPETRNARCDNELRAGLRAKERLASILRSGSVEVLRIGQLDRYGRTLGDLRTKAGMISAILLREGLVLPYQGGAQAKSRRMAHWCPRPTNAANGGARI